MTSSFFFVTSCRALLHEACYLLRFTERESVHFSSFVSLAAGLIVVLSC